MSNGMSPCYPQRPRFFAHRFVRVLHQSCAAQEIGPSACYLCCIIAHTEDASRYAGPARFWNSQLSETMGFRSPQQLVRERDRAVAAGWLVYYRQGTRAVGEYFVTIPPRFQALFGGPIEPHSEEEIHSKNGTNREADRQPFIPLSVPKMERECDGTRNESVTEPGMLPIPSPYPVPNHSPCPEAHASDEQGESRNSRSSKKTNEKRFSAEDKALSDWFWESILAMQPGRKAPNLDQWANTIRLMRECDSRTHAQIRELYSRVQQDPFWRINVLSPDKLREKWDDLQLKLQGNANATGKHNGRRFQVDRAGPGAKYDPNVAIEF